MILAQLNYNNENLIIYKENKNIYFGKLQNNKLITNITEESKQLLTKVYNNLIINKKTSIECGTFKIKEKQIKIYYDKTTNLYYFYEIKQNKLQIPEEELLKQLNLYYNNQSETLYYIENLENTKETKQIKRLIKLNTAIVSIILAANIAYQELPNLDYNLYYKTSTIPKTNQEEPYSYEKIKKSITTNTNLTEYEQYYALSLKKELEENKEYINQETICNNLNNISIKYYKTENPKQKQIVGEYKIRGINKNRISIYQSENQYHIPKTLFHELNHSLTKRSIANDIIIENPNYIEEMANELFSHEYFEEIADQNNLKNYNSYRKQMSIMYPLCEIISDETIRNYKFNNQINIILEELLTLDQDINKACNLITAINSMDLYQKNIYETAQKVLNETNAQQKQKLEKDYIVAVDESITNKTTIYNLIKNYYEKKYNYPMKEDQIMMAYFSDPDLNIPEAKEQIEKIYGEGSKDIYIKSIKPKGYISKYYKQKYSCVELTYRINQEEYKIKIDNTNRYTNKKTTSSEIIPENTKTR